MDILSRMVNLPSLSFWNVLLSAAPLLLVLYLMVGRRWGGVKAGPAGWLLAMLIALLAFGAGPVLLVVAFGRGLLLALFVLYIIWMALLFYHVVNDAGAIAAIGTTLPTLANGRVEQALLLAWVFGSFLQGASGFGVPAAVVAPLLLGLGFAPDVAVVAALMGHAWAVTFGSLGSSFLALMAATGLPGEMIDGPAALLLGICCLGCGVAVLWATDRWAALRQGWLRLLGLTAVMGVSQYLLAEAGLWTLAAFGAGLIGLLVIVVDLRYGLLDTRRARRSAQPEKAAFDGRGLARAFLPYGILSAVILLGSLIVDDLLDLVILNYDFPAVMTRFGWTTPAGAGRSINLFGHPGALLLYTSLLVYGWYRWRGTLNGKQTYDLGAIVRRTVQGSRKSTISIIALVAMAVTMQHAGMTQLLATAMSSATGRYFPLVSPFIGALGAFMTGSNTNSNVVFASLQQTTAVALGLSVPLILAAQTAGGAIGGSFAPAKVIVGASTVENASSGRVLRLATIYSLVILTLIGLLVWGITLLG